MTMLFAAAQWNVHVYLVPLVAVISLVYSATRHEDWPSILRHAWNLAVYIFVCLLVVFGGLMLLHVWV